MTAITKARPWVVALVGIAVAVIAGAQPSRADSPDTARLTIRVVGADMEFRTLGGIDPAFMIPADRSVTFRRLDPGRYVVVQAPPHGGDLWIRCSDGTSMNQYDLDAGEDLTCIFSTT